MINKVAVMSKVTDAADTIGQMPQGIEERHGIFKERGILSRFDCAKLYPSLAGDSNSQRARIPLA